MYARRQKYNLYESYRKLDNLFNFQELHGENGESKTKEKNIGVWRKKRRERIREMVRE